MRLHDPLGVHPTFGTRRKLPAGVCSSSLFLAVSRLLLGLPESGERSFRRFGGSSSLFFLAVFCFCLRAPSAKKLVPFSALIFFRDNLARQQIQSLCSYRYLPTDFFFVFGTKFTMRSIFSMAGWFTIAAHLVRTPFSWELQTFFLSKRGPRRTKFGGHSKNTTA